MMPVRGRQWREGESSPDTGNLSARPAGKPGSLFAKERLRRSLLRHCLVPTTAKHTERSVCVFQAWRNLSGPMWFQNQNQTPGRDRAAFRRSVPGPGKRTRRKGRAPSHRPQMSSGRLFLDRVGRHQSPSLLHRRDQNKLIAGSDGTIYHRTASRVLTGCLTFRDKRKYTRRCREIPVRLETYAKWYRILHRCRRLLAGRFESAL